MRLKYSTTDPSQDEFDSLPRVRLVLRSGNHVVDAIGLVDSGATASVLPYNAGLQLGAIWEDRAASIRLGGNLGNQVAIPLFAMAEVAGLPSARLAFAWIRQSGVPLILGQTNFFMEFDVCFYRSRLEFEVRAKSSV